MLSPTQRFVWRFRGFDWRVSQLSRTSFCLFGVFFCSWPWRRRRTTPTRLHSYGDDSHAAGPPIFFRHTIILHTPLCFGVLHNSKDDFSGRREVFRWIGTYACVHAHMNGYGGLSISASQKSDAHYSSWRGPNEHWARR